MIGLKIIKIFVSKNGQQYGPYDKLQRTDEFAMESLPPRTSLALMIKMGSYFAWFLENRKVPPPIDAATNLNKPKKIMGCFSLVAVCFLGITCLGIFADLVASINGDDEPNDLASVEDESIESPTLDFDTSKAVEYRVLDDREEGGDFSFLGRKRLAFDITSEASTERFQGSNSHASRF